MKSLFRALTEERAAGPISLEQWAQFFTYLGNTYPLGLQQTLVGNKEEPGDWSGLVERAYSANGVVFACVLVRMLVFSEARFQWQQMRDGRPGALFGTPDLQILESPWPNGTTGDLLARMMLDADRAGNAFLTVRNGRIKRMEPDWVSIVLGGESEDVGPYDLDAEIIGYAYFPGGKRTGQKPVTLLRDQVAHFAPIPDPLYQFRGMSWMNPLIDEIQADSAATRHKWNFFRNGATPNMVVQMDPKLNRDRFLEWIKTFEERHTGVENAYRTLYLGGGADAKVVGANIRQIDFKNTQGAGETRIAAAAGVPPVIVGLSEGLAAATYSNYSQARRRFADGTMRPYWRNGCGSLATIVPVPARARLWYDTTDVAFLREDEGDKADIQQKQSIALRQLIEAGFTAESAVAAITANDMTLLKHTGLFSVQLQAPGSPKMPEGEVPGETPVGPGSKPETTPGGKPIAPTGPPRGSGSADSPGRVAELVFAGLREGDD